MAMGPLPPSRESDVNVTTSVPSAGPTSLSQAEFGIRVRYRVRATARWLVAVLVGIVLVVAALALGSTGSLPLAIVSAYSAIALLLAIRSAVLLAQIRP
jgi:hypothetical protein